MYPSDTVAECRWDAGSAAFALVILSALLRVLLPLFGRLTLTGWNLSGWSWVAAYGLFIWVYAPYLTSPGRMAAPANHRAAMAG